MAAVPEPIAVLAPFARLPFGGDRQREGRVFAALLGVGLVAVAIGLYSAMQLERYGHVITGMSNQVVWGLPHVFAIFLIVAASGVLNVASIGSVFGRHEYKERARLAGLLSIAMLAGGLSVLVLDLGRPDRLMVAITHFNFRSVFAWNVFLYSGLFAVVAVYLWTLMERRMNPLSHAVGMVTFVWRFVLTTGTGSIFGFLVARQAYQSAVIAPMFIVMSFAWGLAAFLVVQQTMFSWNGRKVPEDMQRRMTRLLGIFLVGVLYFMLVYHLTNLYYARQTGFERFILVYGSPYAMLFWVGFVFLGSFLPLLMVFRPATATPCIAIAAALLVLGGALAELYVFIIGGQAFPLDIFPGFVAQSTFWDGQVARYTPSLPEIGLAIGGIGVAYTLTVIGVRVLDFLPHDGMARDE